MNVEEYNEIAVNLNCIAAAEQFIFDKDTPEYQQGAVYRYFNEYARHAKGIEEATWELMRAIGEA